MNVRRYAKKGKNRPQRKQGKEKKYLRWRNAWQEGVDDVWRDVADRMKNEALNKLGMLQTMNKEN